MGYKLIATNTKNFAGKSNSIKKDMIDIAVEHIRVNSVTSKEFNRKFRIDCTDGTRDEKEKIIKIQVQKEKYTYASIVIRESAAKQIDTDPAINNIIADAIAKSYDDQTTYELLYV